MFLYLFLIVRNSPEQVPKLHNKISKHNKKTEYIYFSLMGFPPFYEALSGCNFFFIDNPWNA